MKSVGSVKLHQNKKKKSLDSVEEVNALEKDTHAENMSEQLRNLENEENGDILKEQNSELSVNNITKMERKDKRKNDG